MKLEQLLTERAMQTLYHLTSIRDAQSIIQSGQFRLSPNTEAGDTMRDEEIDLPANHYFLSTTRSMQSAFVADMLTEADVILVLSGSRLAQRNRVRPYVDPEARVEKGIDYDEMEERIFSNSSILKIPQPINQTIMAVHCLDIMDVGVESRISNAHVINRGATGRDVYSLVAACRTHQIPLIRHKNMNDLLRLRAL